MTARTRFRVTLTPPRVDETSLATRREGVMPRGSLVKWGLTVLAGAMLALATASSHELRLITWGGYAPDDVIADFRRETGINVLVTISNNEEMISRLRATGGAGFDLAQPSQDRIIGPLVDFGIYKPIDMSQIQTNLFIPSMLEATKANTTYQGQVYGLPHVWGTDGLVVNTRLARNVTDYLDLCRSDLAGKVSYRLRRPTLIAFAFAMGRDPFAAYSDPAAYTRIMDEVTAKLIECKPILKTYWTGADELMGLMRAGEVVAAMAWDFGGWRLNNEDPAINFFAPRSGALGWIDTFALPSRGRNDEGAYKWINFVMRPEIAARITAAAGNFTASHGSDELVEPRLRAQYRASFPPEAIDNIKWYPTIPPGLEEIEGRLLDRIRAAR
jgi:spermidine/putrescine transport system substrate-binding protein